MSGISSWNRDNSSIFPSFLTGMRELPLGILGRAEVEEVVAETGDKIFRMDTEMSSHHQMVGVEDPFDHSKRSLTERTCSANSPVSPFILLGEFLSPDCPVHGLVHGGKRDGPEISFVPVYRLTFLGEIDMAVVH